MSSTKDVCAVIVTFNPDDDFYQNVIILKEQVGKVVVVDNNSDNIDKIERFVCENEVALIKNKQNLGIAKAMNQGAKFAIDNGFSFLLTMDDDSILSNDCVLKMLNVIDNNEKNIVCVGANYKQLDFEGEYILKDMVISSGNLTKLSVYQEVGGFKDELFIDCVDFDFCLKIKSAGYNVAIVKNAKMQHKLGEPIQVKTFFGKKDIVQHTAFRYYYIYRNGRYIYIKYHKEFKTFCCHLRYRNFKHIILVILFHKDKMAKLKAIAKGICDSKKFCKNA